MIVVAVHTPSRLGRWLVSGPPLAYLIVFFALPSLIMVLASFRTPGEFGGLAPLIEEGKLDLNLESYARFFSESVYAQIFLKSFGYALLTTLFCLTLAYPLASLIARSSRRYRDLLLLLVILPFWSNFLIRIYAWMILLGPNAGGVGSSAGLGAPLGTEPRLAFPCPRCIGAVHHYSSPTPVLTKGHHQFVTTFTFRWRPLRNQQSGQWAEASHSVDL